jgi:hypothetical protein
MIDNRVDISSKIFLCSFILLLLLSVVAAYYKFMVLEEYTIYLDTEGSDEVVENPDEEI